MISNAGGSCDASCTAIGCGDSETYPLSHGQRALWFLQRLAPDSGAYNLARALRIRSALDVHALRRTLQKLVDRHAGLRTTFTSRCGEPIQQVNQRVDVCFQAVDSRGWSEEKLRRRLAGEVYRPFDLERGPLQRATLFTLSTEEHVLIVAVHHIVTDLWSLAILTSELGILFAAETTGTPAALRPLKAHYAEHVRKQAELLAGPEGERLWAYWQRQLDGELPVLNLLADRPRPTTQTFRGSSATLRLDPELTRKLKALAKAGGTTLFATSLAAFEVLLHRYTGQKDILVGTPKSGRTARFAGLVGYFVNPVVLRANLSGNPTFTVFLDQVHQTVAGAFQHDAFPFPLLVERLQPARDLSRSPIFQVMFAWQKTTDLVDREGLTSFALQESGKQMALGELSLESVALEDQVSPFDLTLLMAEAGAEVVVSMEYNSDLFDAATIVRMLGRLKVLLEGIVANPDRRVSDLPLLTSSERQQLLADWNDTEAGSLTDVCVHRLFEAQARRTPGAVALLADGESLTYRELNRRANQLAGHLRHLGVGPDVLVGVCLDRSADIVVALLSVLKAGGAFLPLDPAYPRERLALMLQDARAPMLLSLRRLGSWLPADGYRIVYLDSDWESVAQKGEEDPANVVAGENLAYVIYTSGSTGSPKGVRVSHSAIAGHCQRIARYYQLTSKDCVLQFAPLNFDASLEQILPGLTVGARIVLRGTSLWAPAEFIEKVQELGLTVINVTPAYWNQVVREWPNAGALENCLRLVIVGGDSISPESLLIWHQKQASNVRLLNAYGPTEATITATAFEIQPGLCEASLRTVPIGRPLANRTVFILDTHGNPVPIGVPGELHIGGSGLAQGYLNQPEMTSERFVRNPFDKEPGARLYKTGDIARYRPDGNVEFLGRIDHQVKIRGFRIELGEIEAALAGYPGVLEVAVVVREDELGDKRLVAYVAAGAEPLSIADLRQFLKGSLPEHMLPSGFVLLDALPLTAAGKIDRRALLALNQIRSERDGLFVAPRNLVEEILAGIWVELLGIDMVGIHDDFFELGGHSLLATQLVSRVRESFQVELPLRTIFDAPTLAGLAIAIAQHQAEQDDEEHVAQLLGEIEQLSPAEVQKVLEMEF